MPGRNQPRSRRGRSAIARTAMNTNSTNGLGINNGGGMKKGGAHPSATGFMRSKPWQISVPAYKKNYAFKMNVSDISVAGGGGENDGGAADPKCPQGFDCSGIGGAGGCLIAGDGNINPSKYCCTTIFDGSGRCLDASMVCVDKAAAGKGTSKCLDGRTFQDCSGAPKPTGNAQLFGNWYYGAGSVCNNPSSTAPQNSLSLGPACSKATFAAFLEAINNNTEQITRNMSLGLDEAVQNSNFYLGTGFYEADWTSTSGGNITWESIACDSTAITASEDVLSKSLVPKALGDDKTHGWQVMNFGGWGCCGQDTGKDCKTPMGTGKAAPWTWNEGPEYITMCNSHGGASKSTCKYSDLDGTSGTSTNVAAVKPSSTGPNAVWNNKVIKWFINNVKAADIIKRGFNAVSFDIEGVQPGDGLSDLSGLLQKYRDAGLKTIVTVPGNGVSGQGGAPGPEHGGMGWLTAAAGNIDYMCLMYYALIGDTMCSVGGGSIKAISTSLTNNWTGASTPLYGKWRPDQIILGLSFGIGDWQQDIKDVFADDHGVWGNEAGKAFGGVTRWAEFGGKIKWWPLGGKSTKLCPGAPTPPPPPPPSEDCAWGENGCDRVARHTCHVPLAPADAHGAGGEVRCTPTVGNSQRGY